MITRFDTPGPAFTADTRTDPFVSALSAQRQQIVRRVSELLDGEGPADLAPIDPTPQLAALLATTLEELKVIEEELLERHEQLLEVRAQLEANARQNFRLFEAAPACLIVSDVTGTILQANRAAGALLRRTADQLHRKPIVTHVAREHRKRFREELGRVTITQGVHDWRFPVVRHDDVPIVVSAAVHVVGDIVGAGLPSFYWCLRPVPDQAAPEQGN